MFKVFCQCCGVSYAAIAGHRRFCDACRKTRERERLRESVRSKYRNDPEYRERSKAASRARYWGEKRRAKLDAIASSFDTPPVQ